MAAPIVRVVRLTALGLIGLLSLATPGTAQGIPSPESVLGFRPGADFKLATYEESIEYFHRLDDASDRITLLRTGRTSEGRDWWIALISSPENLRDVARYREIADRLAHPTGLTDDDARTLARSGRAMVDISGGLHASEVAGAQHTIALAYELVSSEEPRIAAIREHVITVLWPSLNPDGQTIVADWYRSNVGTPYEIAPMPQLWQKYIGHDNNRDGYMLNMADSLWDQTTSVFAAADDLVGLQVVRRYGRGPQMSPRAIRTMLLSTDGRVVSQQTDLPLIWGAGGRRLFATDPTDEAQILRYRIEGR